MDNEASSGSISASEIRKNPDETASMGKPGFVIAHKILRLTTLDGSHRPTAKATGFVVNQQDGLNLYTCWHVVTGYDCLEPEIKVPPNRRFLLVERQGVYSTDQPGVSRMIGGASTLIPLYDSEGRPVWKQQESHRPHPDLNGIGLYIPKDKDFISISVEGEFFADKMFHFDPGDFAHFLVSFPMNLTIAGYPHGFSLFGDTPEPVFLTRAIASAAFSQPFIILDGICAPGMSGSPLLAPFRHPLHADGYKICGIYAGAIFTDNAVIQSGTKNDRFAALGFASLMHRHDEFRFA